MKSVSYPTDNGRDTAPPPGERWCVMRRDDNANDFMVQDGLTFADATALALEFERRGHKQVYWVRRE